ncbi:MAG: nitroreductase family protein [Ignisphaera sp.]
MEPQKYTELYIEFLRTRRSIRRYREEPVPMDLIYKILDTARYAPSARNMQPWEFIVVTDKEVKDRLAGVYSWPQPIRGAPVGVVVVCDSKLSPYTYQQDCANVINYIMLAAHAYGLGTVWQGLLKDEEKLQVQQILNIPREKIPIAIIALGWPAEKPEARPRKPLEEITYINLYGNKLK